ncbi:MAG: M50 family metallopeptidase [Acidobacteriota bacterium]|nr:M50 family metallopeptidase [Acidobacteriota bacterium]
MFTAVPLGDVRGGWIDPPLPPFEPASGSGRKGSYPTVRLILLALFIGLAIQLFGPSWIQAVFKAVRLENFQELAACLAALVCSIILHEAGHLIAAIFLKFEILGGSLGPFRISRFHGQRSFKFSTRALFSGSVSAIPKRKGPWRNGMMMVVAAGPLSTLLTGLAAAIALPYCSPTGLPREFFGFLAQLSFFLFTLGLIPSGANASVRNDADLFLSLLRRSPRAEEILLYHAVMQVRIEGFRPRYYPEEIIRAIAVSRSRPEMRLLFAQTISEWAIDRGDLESAHAWNHRAAELSAHCPSLFRNQGLAESACLDIVLRGDRLGAGAKLADVDFNTLYPPWFVHRTKAIRALLRCDIFETLAEICRAEYCFPDRMPYYDHQRMLLASIRQAAKTLSQREFPLHAAVAQ